MAANEIKDQANRVLSQTREIAQVTKGLEDDMIQAMRGKVKQTGFPTSETPVM